MKAQVMAVELRYYKKRCEELKAQVEQLKNEVKKIHSHNQHLADSMAGCKCTENGLVDIDSTLSI